MMTIKPLLLVLFFFTGIAANDKVELAQNWDILLVCPDVASHPCWAEGDMRGVALTDYTEAMLLNRLATLNPDSYNGIRPPQRRMQGIEPQGKTGLRGANAVRQLGVNARMACFGRGRQKSLCGHLWSWWRRLDGDDEESDNKHEEDGEDQASNEDEVDDENENSNSTKRKIHTEKHKLLHLLESFPKTVDQEECLVAMEHHCTLKYATYK